MVRPLTERGQLMLVGAIAVAFILLTMVVLFNGILFTETISSSQTKDATTRTLVVEHELQNVGSDIVDRNYLPASSWEGNATDDLEDQAEEYNEVVLNSRSASIEFIEIEDPNTDPIVLVYSYNSQEVSIEEMEIEVPHP